MNLKQIRLACELGNIKTWSLDLKTGRLGVSGDDHSIRGLDVNAPLSEHLKTIHPDDAVVMTAKLAAINEENPNYEMEYRALPNASDPTDIKWHWYLAKGTVQAGIVYGIVIDITDRKENELFLKASLELLTTAKEQIQAIKQEIEF